VKVGKIAAVFSALVVLFAVSAQYAKAQAPEEERAGEDLREANAVSKRHRAELMKIPHVKVVTGEVNSRNEAAILIEVDSQKNVDEVMRSAPSQIEGYPVEVDEAPPEDDPNSAIGHWGQADPDPPPTIDKDGYFHHTWLKPAMPVATPGASQ
jgi:hypothetical protein